ncbi:hypothetical protein CY34DRAFT_799148 [Suillus luteus UH-Slu-Lm8-n1]|uniref:Secreted protein n=1 Tax=Suillus luteus UH-Slu-Lm8-n1 TaxID=930992 RepID=A0A0D0B100_9AGAM|nr:hypothetical protein CY34DRAFT_799148 [Suillus luteus UH-Slu-Lm8-n1]
MNSVFLSLFSLLMHEFIAYERGTRNPGNARTRTGKNRASTVTVQRKWRLGLPASGTPAATRTGDDPVAEFERLLPL